MGVIFISIDDNEHANVKKIGDEIFGEDNFVSNIIWQKKSSPSNDAKWISDNHDHILVFAKDKNTWRPKKLERTDAQNAIYKNSDDFDGIDGNEIFYGRGTWFAGDMTVKTISESALYEITTPSGRKVKPAEGRAWVYSKQKFKELCADNRITFGKSGNNKPCIKRFLTEVEKSKIVPKSVWLYQEVGENRNGRQEVKVLFDDKGFFDTPKPVSLLSRILQISSSNSNDIILDFFSGSATTAHAVMQLNGEDNGNRKFIMVQLPEETDEKSEAYKAGYKTIADIGKERIRRAGQKIVEDNQDKEDINKLDIGFRVYKTDSSNMKEVYYHPEQLSQDDLFSLESNIKEDRTPDDLLTQVILGLGLELNLPIEKKEMHGNNIFIVQTNALVACFDDNINIKIIDEIAQLKPFKVVFKDSSFANSKDRINLEERFKRLSPETLITVI